MTVFSCTRTWILQNGKSSYFSECKMNSTERLKENRILRQIENGNLIKRSLLLKYLININASF